MIVTRALIALGLIASLTAPVLDIRAKEQLRTSGHVVLLELAPRDPRSLMQGDYMALEYALTRQLENVHDWPLRGALVIRQDADGVATFVRLDEGSPLGTGEHRLTYRRNGRRVHVGSDAFFFQEGLAHLFEDARYGELRVAEDGTSLLVGLRDEERRPLTYRAD